MDHLCDDVIDEILKRCSYRTTASFLSTTKRLYHHANKVEKMKQRRQLSSQLLKATTKTRSYYKSEILDRRVVG